MKKSVLRACLFSIGFTLAPLALASSEGAVAGCGLSCDQSAVQCERKLGPNGHCTRKRSECVQQCESRTRPASVKPTRHTLCTQRCDLDRSICGEANPKDVQACVDGQAACIERCD